MSRKKMDIVYFTESQGVRRFQIRLVLLFEIIFFSGIVYRQLVMGKPFGPYPVTDSGLIVLSLLFIVPVTVLFFIKFKVTVGRDGICYKMIPMGLFKYKISRQQIKSFSVETGKQGRSNKTSGLKVVLKNKKSIFLPSLNPDELFRSVKQMMAE